MRPFTLVPGSGLAGAVGAVLSALSLSLLQGVSPAPSTIPESDAIARVYHQALPGVVQVVDSGRLAEGLLLATVGSGFVVDLDGHILTNEHVVRTVHDPGVVFSDGSIVQAELVGQDPSHDLAVLEVAVPRERLYPLSLGDSSRLEVGRRVVAIGSPFGLGQTLTSGVVSYVGRPMAFRDGIPPMETIQTDAAINPGNSGGPLLDLSGHVVGVNVGGCLKSVWTFDGGSVGVGFAVPSTEARRLLPELIEGSLAARPWLGVTVVDARSSAVGGVPDPSRRGAMIVATQVGGPSERAGLRGVHYSRPSPILQTTTSSSEGRAETTDLAMASGDVVVAIDGHAIESADGLAAYLARSGRRVGDVVALRVEREGQVLEVPVRLTARDESQVGAV